jgi:predicted ATPase
LEELREVVPELNDLALTESGVVLSLGGVTLAPSALGDGQKYLIALKALKVAYKGKLGSFIVDLPEAFLADQVDAFTSDIKEVAQEKQVLVGTRSEELARSLGAEIFKIERVGKEVRERGGLKIITIKHKIVAIQ